MGISTVHLQSKYTLWKQITIMCQIKVLNCTFMGQNPYMPGYIVHNVQAMNSATPPGHVGKYVYDRSIGMTFV